MRTEFGDYDLEYGRPNYEGAVVLDLGADYGTTADYFLSRGAAKVVVCEKRPAWVERLHAKASVDPRIVVEPAFENAQDLRRMLEKHRPRVVKCDVEGAELHLLAVGDAFMIPIEYVMETHSRELCESFATTLNSYRYEVETVKEWPHDPATQPSTKHRAILYAMRQW